MTNNGHKLSVNFYLIMCRIIPSNIISKKLPYKEAH